MKLERRGSRENAERSFGRFNDIGGINSLFCGIVR